ncbi:hypothetical protein BDF22DRAFT_249605 [Syncephalis plumigaleata]|nr:hypothetical protein BDF22DRAFT_249605 [Syncephalis plumigaleata]
MSRPTASSEQPSNNYPQRRRNSNDIDNRNVLFYEEVEEEEIGGGGEGTTDALLVTAIKQGEQRLDRNNNDSNINTTERLNMNSALSSSYSNSNSNNNMRSYEQLHYQDPASPSGSRTALYRSLTFWPIPPITRGAILVTIVISLWAAYRLIRVYCTAPSYVIYREDITPLLLSPWYIPGQLSAILVAITNFILMSIYEKSLVHLLGGYLFCRGTGWAVPSLFFSNSVHECSYGLAPLLASTLMLQALRPNEKYMVYYGRQSHQYVTVYK